MQDINSDDPDPPSSPGLPQDLSSSSKKDSDIDSEVPIETSDSGSDSDKSGYSCSVCSARLDSQHELTLHIRSHNEDPTQCKVCGKTLGSASSLDRHVLVHSGERPFRCSVCGLTFTTNGNMHRHMRSHEGGGKRKMETNNNEVEVVKRKSRRGDKGDRPRFECPMCDVDFLSLHGLETHLEENHPKYQAQCDECNLIFKNYRVLNLHRFMVHYKEEEVVKDLSLVEFSSEKFPLIAKSMLEKPESKENRDEEPTDLSNKNSFLANLDLRTSPKKEDINILETPPDSGAKFFEEEEQDCFAAELRRMKLRGEFPCRLCTAVFPNLRALKGHNRVHLSGGELQCNMCLFTSPDKGAVIRHMRTHNGDRPYECGLCNYAFTTKANCERHLRNRHSAGRLELKSSIIYHPEVEEEDEDKREVGTMTTEAPLDLSMDVLDLSTKKAEEEPEDLTTKRPPFPFYAPQLFPFIPPYFLPPPLFLDNIKKELIRNLEGLKPPSPKPDTPPPQTSVKMVIKNGVLVPKQKQRRYRTERPFGCAHCTARFTLRSNMERHVKQQHPQFWSSRSRSGGRRVPRPPSTPPEKERISEGVRLAIVEQIKTKMEDKKDDLASVSRLLDNASTQTFKFFQENPEGSDEEGLVASHSEENSGSEEKPEEAPKKKSAYSLAPNRVSCPYCFRKFPWSSSLRRHILTHTGQKPYKCPFCPLLFTTKSNCDRHLLRKHGGAAAAEEGESRTVPERPYKCKKCPSSTFSTLGNLKKHVGTKHEEAEEERPAAGTEMPFKCHLCDGAFAERQEALDHLRENHEPEYDSLVSKGALESSAEEVEEEQDPSAPSDRKFPDYANRKVICAFCLRRFWSAEDLRRHMRTHTGERPFSCDVCTRRFTLKHSMLRHRKKHAGAPAPSSNSNTSDLIGNLLGIGDVDSILDKSAEDAARLLGVQK